MGAPERAYRDWHRRKDASWSGTPPDVFPKIRWMRADGAEGSSNDFPVEETATFGLGQSQLVQVEFGTFVLNMVAQHGLFRDDAGRPPLHYDALALCLRHADAFCRRLGASLHMPRIGCGLGGGSWERVGQLVTRLTSVPTHVYDLPHNNVT